MSRSPASTCFGNSVPHSVHTFDTPIVSLQRGRSGRTHPHHLTLRMMIGTMGPAVAI